MWERAKGASPYHRYSLGLPLPVHGQPRPLSRLAFVSSSIITPGEGKRSPDVLHVKTRQSSFGLATSPSASLADFRGGCVCARLFAAAAFSPHAPRPVRPGPPPCLVRDDFLPCPNRLLLLVDETCCALSVVSCEPLHPAPCLSHVKANFPPWRTLPGLDAACA